MSVAQATTGVRGKRVRFIWKDGPTKGTTHEHAFHDDGTVEWHAVKAGADASGKADAERPRYSDESVGDDVRLVSYLSRSGFTLTVALNFADGTITGVASDGNTWTPVHGSFEVVS